MDGGCYNQTFSLIIWIKDGNKCSQFVLAGVTNIFEIRNKMGSNLDELEKGLNITELDFNREKCNTLHLGNQIQRYRSGTVDSWFHISTEFLLYKLN